jgi:hypothetical protein
MSERLHFESMNPKEHIQRELEDAGIKDPSEWRKALDLETPLDEAEEKFASKEGRNFNFEKILTYLEGDKRISDKEKIKQFSETHDSIERLEILHSMSLTDAVACVRDYAESDGSYRYLAGRLNFYQKFITGEATKKQTESEWDDKKREYVQVEKEYPIDASSATPETIRVGLLRDIEFASMKGTPELGIYQVTEKRLKAKNTRNKHLLPALKGFNSGIGVGVGSGRWLTKYLWMNLENSDDRPQSERIGYGYTFLRKTFEESKALIVQKRKGEPLDEEVLEHRAVIQAANWLEEAMNYNDPGRPLGSPYMGSIQESIAWARLGDPSVKKQIRGMRVKIQESDLRNIGRFIGKSGINRYDGEHKRLFGQLKLLREGDENAKQEFTTRENNFATQKQERWLARETEKVNRWLEKSKVKIDTYDIPDSEKQEILDTVQRRYEEKLANLDKDYRDEVDRLTKRSPDELLAALQERQGIVNQRYEKRKSLAQKALDLHFAFNHEGGNYGSKPLSGLVDWINYAPLGTIKRSHRLLKQGVSDEQITTRALADIITGAREVGPEDVLTVQTLVQKAKGQDHGAQQKLQGMSKVGNILSRFDYEVPLADLESMATKSYHGMTEALKMYDLEQVKQFMDQGINLQSVTTVKKVTEKYGHDLSPIEVAEIASHNIDGLDDAMRTFDLEAIRTLLKQDVNLPIAVAVLNNTRQFGYELEIAQIASVAKNVRDLDDFTAGLKGLPLPEVEKIFSDGIAYSEYSQVKEALQKHQLDSGFDATHALAKKLTRTREYYNLDSALDTFSLEEIEQVLDKGSALSGVLEVGNALKAKEIATNLQEIILFEKYAGDYSKGHFVTQAVDAFGIDSVRKIVAKSCRLDKAVEVNNYINTDSNSSSRRSRSSSDNGISESLRESLKKGGLDVVIAIAKAGNMEAAVKTVEAGFTVEEITRFPFLISPLVTKK